MGSPLGPKRVLAFKAENDEANSMNMNDSYFMNMQVNDLCVHRAFGFPVPLHPYWDKCSECTRGSSIRENIRFAWRGKNVTTDFQSQTRILTTSERAKLAIENAGIRGLRFIAAPCWLDPDPAYGDFERRRWIKPPIWRCLVENACAFQRGSRCQMVRACEHCGHHRFEDTKIGSPILAESMHELDVAFVGVTGLIVSSKFRQAIDDSGLTGVMCQPLEEINVLNNSEYRARRDEVLALVMEHARGRTISIEPGDVVGDDTPYAIPPWTD
jgi:hypothetical protein